MLHLTTFLLLNNTHAPSYHVSALRHFPSAVDYRLSSCTDTHHSCITTACGAAVRREGHLAGVSENNNPDDVALFKGEQGNFLQINERGILVSWQGLGPFMIHNQYYVLCKYLQYLSFHSFFCGVAEDERETNKSCGQRWACLIEKPNCDHV